MAFHRDLEPIGSWAKRLRDDGTQHSRRRRRLPSIVTTYAARPVSFYVLGGHHRHRAGVADGQGRAPLTNVKFQHDLAGFSHSVGKTRHRSSAASRIPEYGSSQVIWSELPPQQIRLDELVNTIA